VLVIDGLGFSDAPVQLDVEFGMPSVSQAQDLEMLRLATGLANRLEARRTRGFKRNRWISGPVVIMMVLVLVLDRHGFCAASKVRYLELGWLLLAFDHHIGPDPKLDHVRAMRGNIGEERAVRGLDDKAMRKNVRDPSR
jgi:hypothetical protein